MASASASPLPTGPNHDGKTARRQDGTGGLTSLAVLPSCRPAVLTAEIRGLPRVVTCNVEASRRGIVFDMPLTQAKALAGDLAFAPWDDERLARAALKVTAALLAASPRVAWDGKTARRQDGKGDGVWWVDAAGLGDEQRFAQLLLRIAKKVGFGPARIGVADSAIAAYAATFRSPAARPPNRLTAPVPSGRDAAFLAPYPVGLLALDDDLAETLGALGLTTIGQLAALDADEVESRFGPDGLAAHRLARGLDGRGPSLPRDDTLPTVTCELGDPVAHAEPLLFVMKGALASLGGTLRSQGLAAREVVIALTLDDGSTVERAVRPARPTAHDVALFDHCRATLDDWQLPEPVTVLAIRASETVPAAGEQGNLLSPRWADPAALEAAFDRIRGKEGSDAVAVAEFRDGHLPADAGAWGYGRTDVRTHGQVRERPVPRSALRLLAAPRSARVRLGRSGLEAFRDGDIWHDVTVWSGPERLTPRWWQQRAAARDYFTARATDGTLWLLYRAAKAWFVEGWWD